MNVELTKNEIATILICLRGLNDRITQLLNKENDKAEKIFLAGIKDDLNIDNLIVKLSKVYEGERR